MNLECDNDDDNLPRFPPRGESMDKLKWICFHQETTPPIQKLKHLKMIMIWRILVWMVNGQYILTKEAIAILFYEFTRVLESRTPSPAPASTKNPSFSFFLKTNSSRKASCPY